MPPAKMYDEVTDPRAARYYAELLLINEPNHRHHETSASRKVSILRYFDDGLRVLVKRDGPSWVECGANQVPKASGDRLVTALGLQPSC